MSTPTDKTRHGATTPRRAASTCAALAVFSALGGIAAALAQWPHTGTDDFGETESTGNAVVATIALVGGLSTAAMLWVASIALNWAAAMFTARNGNGNHPG